jgi:ATP-dependent DNA helicase RecG
MTVPVSSPAPSPLSQPVTVLWGVGGERAAQLERLDIRTVEDLLLHGPRRYEDRREFRPIARMTTSESAVTRGVIVALGVKRFRQGTKSVFEFILEDGSARLHCRWWNLPFMENYFEKGQEVVVYGKLTGLKPRTMDHPETEVVEVGEENFIHLNRITPVYPLTEGLPQRWLRATIWRTLERYMKFIPDPWPEISGGSQAGATEGLPIEPSAGNAAVPRFPTRARAIQMLHFPGTMEEAELGRQRLALEEFILLQRDIRMRRMRFEAKSRGLPCGGDNRLIKPFLAQLGFTLTGAQTRVLREIRHDMAGRHPMRRLLQGDVGSGKTVVAACAALMALESGYAVVLMAPTEILAGQHHQNLLKWFEPLGIPVALRTGSRKTDPGARGADETALFNKEPAGRAGIVIGTHALIESGFEIPNLGLVIIDEQHKFGVTQREQLLRKGHYPHLLVMTATPIPRTLGLTLYGDLDISVIDQIPGGRGRIRTFLRPPGNLPRVWEYIRDKLSSGRQAYVVYPRLEDTGGGGMKAVTAEFESVKKALAPHRVALLHGRLGGREKEEVMKAFRAGAVQALLATSLVEVGLDVPNATVMLVENAEQFGLAQLHQLRGRIGRGTHESHCILVSGKNDFETQRRLAVMERTNDGFEIAEADLRLRGPGELLGQQQSGLPRFRFGNLQNDLNLVHLARDLAVRAAPGTV